MNAVPPAPQANSLMFSWFGRLRQVLANEPQDKEQLITLLRDAQKRNLFNTDTLNMIEGALAISEMQVRDIIIPRAQMIALYLDDTPEDMMRTVIESGHSRFPMLGENKDDVQGIFLAKDLLEYFAQGKPNDFNPRDLMRPAVFVPESKRLNILLREFRTSRNHMAIVVDEYGGVAGLVTIEDVIEQIVGDIDDEHDFDDQVYIKPRETDIYSVLALTPIEEFNDYFKTNFSDEEFDTIGGVVINTFGHLPQRGEKTILDGLEFEVIRSNSRRLHLLRVKRLAYPPVTDEDYIDL
ncbi:putative Mg2+ and Co2+ transporter CorC [Beggiatoa alba B18LD]|uniref:Magnesium and cobalt efflux protein CorC n=1 Tax=Beggiatoa alba B18LD TaxID=395493 RepID=I3CCD8_9GAMM|nr:transporter associated domain-containing protein [Beggiatoa alba]EIJ41281.1 putative Mg2+ and Co2+ transporter CorC [Beggiatoa alba B18LD]